MRGTYVLPQRHHHPKTTTILFIVFAAISLIVTVIVLSGVFKMPSFVPQPQAVVSTEAEETESSKIDNSQIDVSETEVGTKTQETAPSVTSEKEQTVAATETEKITPTDRILVVSEQYWESATFRVSKSDGSQVPGVNFTVPKGTAVHALRDGVVYISSATYKQDGRDVTTLLLSIVDDENWDRAKDPGAYRIDLMTNDLQLAEGIEGQARVKKGQLIGTVGSEDLIFSDLDQNAGNLAVAPIGSWAKDELAGIEDPLSYLQKLASIAGDDE
jgi:hypothetical protein